MTNVLRLVTKRTTGATLLVCIRVVILVLLRPCICQADRCGIITRLYVLLTSQPEGGGNQDPCCKAHTAGALHPGQPFGSVPRWPCEFR